MQQLKVKTFSDRPSAAENNGTLLMMFVLSKSASEECCVQNVGNPKHPQPLVSPHRTPVVAINPPPHLRWDRTPWLIRRAAAFVRFDVSVGGGTPCRDFRRPVKAARLAATEAVWYLLATWLSIRPPDTSEQGAIKMNPNPGQDPLCPAALLEVWRTNMDSVRLFLAL